MSYLDVPRIHFAGRFYTDPSTLNNDPNHWTPGEVATSPWQEPRGLHQFRLVDCTVRSALGPAGPVPGDPLIGCPVESTDEPAIAKIADLDVYQQAIPCIYGLQLQIPVSDGASLTGSLVPAPELNSCYFQRLLPTRGWDEEYGAGSYGQDSNATGVFQTTIRVPVDSWPAAGVSPLLDALKAATHRGPYSDPLGIDPANGEAYYLSIKFTADSYINVAYNSEFRYGRITGAIGPWQPEEPVQAVGPRWLQARPLPEPEARAGEKGKRWAQWFVPNFYGGPFQVDERRKKLVIDLANSLCLEKFKGPPVDLGDLTAYVVPPGGTRVRLGVLPKAQYSTFGYEHGAGLCELDLTDAQLAQVRSAPLELHTSRKDIGPQRVLFEDPSGLWFAPDHRSFRLALGGDIQTANTRVRFTQWGRPVAGKSATVQVVSVTGTTPSITVPPINPRTVDPDVPGSGESYPGNPASAEGALVAKLAPSDADGWATVDLELLRDPGARTLWLDSSLYFIWLYEGDKAPAHGPPQEQMMSAIAWADYPVKKNPTWDDVEHIFDVYAHLFPGMTDKVDLTSQHAVHIFIDNPPWFVAFGVPKTYQVDGLSGGAVPFYLTRTINDPRYMPVTRDLCPNKTETLLNYVRKVQSTEKPTPPPPPPSR